MPFSLKNAVATLEKDLNLLKMGLTWEEVFIYLDDLIVFAPMFEVFGVVGKSVPDTSNGKPQASSEQMFFGHNEVKYLGQVMSKE